jgi:indolepyruvate ferredoxin oxidoreductase
MAYKDEYEVARLYTDGSFMKQLKSQFEGKMRLEFHLAPPLRGKKDAKGLPVKQSYGPRMMLAFRLLAPFKFLRGTPLDLFGYTKERRTERHLIRTYEKRLGELITGLTPLNHLTAVEIASLPEKIRGFGHVKERNLALVLKEEAVLLEKFHNLIPQQAMAAE